MPRLSRHFHSAGSNEGACSPKPRPSVSTFARLFASTTRTRTSTSDRESIATMSTMKVRRQLSPGVDDVSVGLRSFTKSWGFRCLVYSAVSLNAVTMGLEAEYKGEGWSTVWQVSDQFFTAIFTLEMLLQIAALRAQYFADPWNILDFIIVVISIMDAWLIPLLASSDHKSSIGVFRIFRLLRLLRLAKIMKAVPEFTMVVEGLIASLKAVGWIFLLLLFLLYACAICCVEVVGTNKTDYPAHSETTIEEDIVKPFNSYLYFGSVRRSMMSLLNMVLLSEWHEIVRPVFEQQFAMALFFICLVVVSVFGILNVIIGVVVERTTEAMEELQASRITAIKEKQMKQASALADLVFAVDDDGNEMLNAKELAQLAKFNELDEILNELDLPYEFNFQELFQMLDVDGDGHVSKNEFIIGIMRLIWCDDFQRDCLMTCALGQLKQQVGYLKGDMAAHIKEQLAQELNKSTERILHSLQFGYAQPAEMKFVPGSAKDKVDSAGVEAKSSLQNHLYRASPSISSSKSQSSPYTTREASVEEVVLKAHNSATSSEPSHPSNVPSCAPVCLHDVWHRDTDRHDKDIEDSFQDLENHIVGLLPIVRASSLGLDMLVLDERMDLSAKTQTASAASASLLGVMRSDLRPLLLSEVQEQASQPFRKLRSRAGRNATLKL